MKRVGLAILSLSAALFAQENPAYWSKYKVLSVNTKASGANVAGTVAKFPILVRLNATNANDVFTEARPGGADLRFSNAAGTAFRPYEIEHWDATAKTAAIWVQADSVKGNDSVATLRLYWGRANYSSASNGPAVFDTSAGWRAVYHMNGGTAAMEMDATVHGFTMVASDTVPAAVPGDTIGVVGKARMFKGDSTTIAGRQYFVAPNTAGAAALNIGANNPHTISSWVYARAINPSNASGNSVFNKGDQQYALQIYGNAGATGVKQWESAVYTSTWRQAKSKAPAVPGVWTHVTGTWTGGANATNGTGKFYLNGVLDTTISLGIGTVSAQQAYNLFIGANPNGGGTNATAPGDNRALSRLTTTLQRSRFWDGYIDDITLARAVRSDDYVKLTYETQKPAASAVVLGTTQTQTAPTPVAISNIYYVMPGAGNAPRDTMNFAFNQSVNLGLNFDGGPADSIKVTTGTLPAGLTVDKFTGRLSGTAGAAYPAANLTLTVYASTGNVTRGLRISVASGALVLQKYTQDTATYATSVPMSNAPVFSVNGRAATKVKIAPALPAGIKIDTVTGVISGTPTAASAATNYTVTAYNSTDSSSRVVRFTVVDISTENYATGWTVHKDIWLNTQGNGAATATGVGKFPVLVRLTPEFIGTGAQPLANGADFRFTKEGDIARLPYEIESWNSTTKTGAVWVRVDTVLANNGTQKFRMHWGNATAPSLSSGPSVFDTAAGFQAVWHLNGTADEADATVNGFTAVAANGPTSAAGVIGPARVFNGTSQYFVAPNTASGVLNFKQTQSYTLSAWINPTAISTAANTGHKIIDKGDNQYVLATYGADEASRYWEITIKANNTWNQCQADGSFAGSTAVLASSSVNAWNHLVGTYTGGPTGTEVTQRLFYNGKLVNQCVISNTDTTGRTETHHVHLGVQSGTAPSGNFTRYWQGMLDEPRLANKARSVDWVKLEYANQKASAQNNLVSFTAPVALNGAMASMAAKGLSFKALNNGVQFTVNGLASGEKATLSLVDAFGRTVFDGAFQGNKLNWNGRANNGQEISAGIYIARVKILGADGRANKVLEHRVPFTR